MFQKLTAAQSLIAHNDAEMRRLTDLVESKNRDLQVVQMRYEQAFAAATTAIRVTAKRDKELKQYKDLLQYVEFVNN